MRWEFKQEPAEPNRWRWQCAEPDTGSILKMSQVPFKSRDECIEDAKKNGYKAPDQPPSPGLETQGAAS